MGNVQSVEEQQTRPTQPAIMAYPSYPSGQRQRYVPPSLQNQRAPDTRVPASAPIQCPQSRAPLRKAVPKPEARHDGRIVMSTQREAVSARNVEQKIAAFEDEQARLQEAVERIKRRRAEMFQQELSAFEQKFNPFEVLGLSEPTNDLALIKRAYRKQSLRHHPDKGGSEVKFEAVTKAYMYIVRKLEHLNVQVQDFSQLRGGAQEFKQTQETDQRENIHVDKDRFNAAQFNEIYDKYRLDMPEDDGYGEMMDTADRSQQAAEIPTNAVFSGKFNREVFNSIFKDNKDEDDETQLIVYDEPQPLISSGLAYAELGIGKITDFGQNEKVSGGKYTDYKRAYGRDSKLINPDKVSYKSYKNVDDLERDRDNISYDLSPEDRRKLDIKQQKQELDDEERMMRLKEFEAKAFATHDKLNKLMIRN